MIWKLSPAEALSSSPARFWVPPTLMVPTLSVPGRARAPLMKSSIVLNSESTLVAKTRSNAPICETVANSFTGSNGGADRGAVGDEADGVAVGRLREHRARRRDAARSGLILHHETLPELVAELLGREARGDVGDAGGGERQDEADRTVGIVLLRAHAYRKHRGGRSRGRKRQLPSRHAVVRHIHLPFSFRRRSAHARRVVAVKHAGAPRATPAPICRPHLPATA